MQIEIGFEKKFFEFMSELNEKEKIALISHIDLDGITSAKIVNEVVDVDELKFLDYEELNEDLINKLKRKKIKRVFFTDLCISDDNFLKKLESFAKILILDHHKNKDLNSERTVYIKGEDGYSAGFLCYNLFNKIKNVEEYDWLVACSCISDYCHLKPGYWLERIFNKYGDVLEYKDGYVRRSGKIWELQLKISLALIYFKKKKNIKKIFYSIGKNFGEIGVLNKYSNKVQKEIDKIVKQFKEKKEIIEQGYLYEISPKFPVAPIVSAILSEKEKNKLFLVVTNESSICKISARRQDKKLDCGVFLKEILKGFKNSSSGGHISAAGGHFMKKNLPEFRKRLGLPLNKKV